MKANHARTHLFSRREFLRSSILLSAVTAGLPSIVPSSVLGENAPSKQLTMGIIGCGNQSAVDIPEWLNNEDCRIVAVCDVNKGSHGYKTPKQFLGREPQRDFVNKFYAQKKGVGSYKGCDMYTDFRDLLARKDIDAVAIITPDHWHAVMTVLSARAGKDIYCQKPLTLTVREGREMIQAVRQHRRVLQTGSQYRSNAVMRRACELVRNGRIGKLQRIETFIAPNNFQGPGPGWKEMPVPDGLDYDLWLGPAPMVPYHKDRCLYRFRFIRDYSGGQTTNFGCHSNNIAHWAMGMDESGPDLIEDLGAEFPPDGDLFNTPTKVAFRAHYANGVVLDCKTDPLAFGAKFFGSEGWLCVTSKGIECEPASIKDSVIADTEVRLPVSGNHYRNFLDCVKSRKDPVEPVEVGHRTASLCHLGNIAMILKQKIKWNPATEEVVGNDEAARMLGHPMRAPWAYDMPFKA